MFCFILDDKKNKLRDEKYDLKHNLTKQKKIRNNIINKEQKSTK